ncbi:S8 family serine peptidase [Mariniflexile maritimum]|uniref:S8 family serine peptidase n=1 Tax=Mariniflexile maritimum TaxID=2682493 RepID=UPI0012F698D8|nr:S8 family serine peptidase [Mariniflexile maritimum]
MDNHILIKRLLFIHFFIVSLFLFAQKEEIFTYYIHMNGAEKGKEFILKNNKAFYNGKNSSLKSFFNNSDIKSFYQAFPDIPDPKLENIYVIKTSYKQLCKDLLKKFPTYYVKANDITGGITMLSYPNDYGKTSPVANLGINVARKDLDYIGAPNAWNITTGSSNIKVGISDTGVNNALADLEKTNYISGYGSTNAAHGSNVAALAAAQGDNGVGTVGVCYDCGILAAPSNFGYTSDVVYSQIYKLASQGAKVINMSWLNSLGYGPDGHGFLQEEQDVIDYCVNNFGTIFVAAAGNISSFSTPTLHHPNLSGGPFGTLYVYPASYNNVISVSLVNDLNTELNSDSFCCTTPLIGALYDRIEDSVSPQIDGTDINNPLGISGSNGYGLIYMATLNPKVDILAPGYNQFEYWDYSNNQEFIYNGTSTSYAAPLVTGTIGLMLSVNPCLTGPEVEDVLQLVSKDIEHMPINASFFGMVGSGKLETGNSVQFVNEMMKADGIAVIKDHVFYRFDFNLINFMNNLVIENVSFIDSATVTFKAKNSIVLLDGALFEPNTYGFIDLSIDGALSSNCLQVANSQNSFKIEKTKVSDFVDTNFLLFPNPTNDVLNIKNKEYLSTVSILDVTGKIIYFIKNINSKELQLNTSIFNSGMYFIKIKMQSGEVISKKIIKN